MARKKYSCDFETTTDPLDCRVWAYGYMEIGNDGNYKIGNSLEEFMAWVAKCNSDLYFHNLRFDGEFILIWLLQNGFKWSDKKKPEPMTFNGVVSRDNAVYRYDICYGYTNSGKKIHTVIYDSYKKLPYPVKVIAKAFNLPQLKGDIDYDAYRPVGHKITEEEYKYIYNDIKIIADALKIQFEQGLKKMTIGSDSLNGFKSIYGKKQFEKTFPVLDMLTDDFIRLSYKGGFTWLNPKFANVVINKGRVYDVNSMYPAIMYNELLPYGVPVRFKGKYEQDDKYPLYIQQLSCIFELKEGKIPMIQVKNEPLKFKGSEYLTSSRGYEVKLTLTNVELELFLENYKLNCVEYLGGYKFKGVRGIFKTFIDKWMNIKMNSEGAIRELAKLMLNNLYGKFATNPDVTGKYPELKEDGSLGFKMKPRELSEPVYTAMGSFITAYGRCMTVRTGQSCYDRFIYADTDSVHVAGNEDIPEIADKIDSKKLGFWDHEATFETGKYVRSKAYFLNLYAKKIIKDGEEIIKPCGEEEATTRKRKVACAGMPETLRNIVPFEEFKIGYTGTRLAPRHVKGGIVLVDAPYTLKEDLWRYA